MTVSFHIPVYIAIRDIQAACSGSLHNATHSASVIHRMTTDKTTGVSNHNHAFMGGRKINIEHSYKWEYRHVSTRHTLWGVSEIIHCWFSYCGSKTSAGRIQLYQYINCMIDFTTSYKKGINRCKVSVMQDLKDYITYKHRNWTTLCEWSQFDVRWMRMGGHFPTTIYKWIKFPPPPKLV